MRESPIFIIDTDAAKLRGLLVARAGDRDSRDQEHLLDLASELERASVVKVDAVPNGVVMLKSQVQVVDLFSGERRNLTLVFPSEAEPSIGRVSALAPLGCALMGQREGEVVEWEMPGGLRRLRIEKVRSAGNINEPGKRDVAPPPIGACILGEGTP